MDRTLYLDNAASSHPKPPEVLSAVEGVLMMGANPGRSGHRLSLDAARVVTDARESVARLINIGDSSKIVFTLNATHAINQALWGFLKPGDRVVTTTMEHNSVLRPLHALGVEVTFVRADPAGFVDPDDVKRALATGAKLVVINHASNVCGTLQDAAAIGLIAREGGARFLLDASQTLGSIPVDVQNLKADMVAAPGHKGLLGPQGTGFLYVSDEVKLKPLMYGGTGFLSESPDMPEEMPERLEAGTLNTPGIAGLGAGVEYLLSRGVESIREDEVKIIETALRVLPEVPGLELYGPKDAAKRVAVFSFNLKGKDGAHVGYALDEAFGIAVRVGLHCAPDAHRTIGSFPEGAIRASFGPFNTAGDAETLARALARIANI